MFPIRAQQDRLGQLQWCQLGGIGGNGLQNRQCSIAGVSSLGGSVSGSAKMFGD